MYVTDCMKCHENGEKSVYGKTRPFSTLSEDEILISLKKYIKWDRKDDLGALMRIFLLNKSDEELLILTKGIKLLKDKTFYKELQVIQKQDVEEKTFFDKIFN